MSRKLLSLFALVGMIASASGQDPLPSVSNQNSGFEPVQNQATIKNTTQEIDEVLPSPPQPVEQQPESLIQPKKVLQPKPIPVAPGLTPFAVPQVESSKSSPQDVASPALSEDKAVYRSANNLSSGVSDYRFEVAKQRAQARRMRIEAKKWYGIDSARPNVTRQGDHAIYSAYYNGVFARPAYYYNRGSSFYFYQSFPR